MVCSFVYICTFQVSSVSAVDDGKRWRTLEWHRGVIGNGRTSHNSLQIGHEPRILLGQSIELFVHFGGWSLIKQSFTFLNLQLILRIIRIPGFFYFTKLKIQNNKIHKKCSTLTASIGSLTKAM